MGEEALGFMSVSKSLVLWFDFLVVGLLMGR